MAAKVDSMADPAIDSDNNKKSLKELEAEQAPSIPVVDEETEKRLLKKLDRRIIPIACWIYLMNFMDRGECAPSSQ